MNAVSLGSRGQPVPSRLENGLSKEREPIAIIGIGCRLPGKVNDHKQYWDLLCQGVDAIEEVPANRWDQFKFYDSEPGQQGKIITKWGGFVRDIDQFDPAFFGISPREAASMDPQQRLVLESAWEALEDAGLQVEKLSGTKVGVFVGVSTFDYGLMQNTFNDVTGAGPYTNTGQALSICANRLSFLMNWKGPSFIVDTACSSSLLACHMAINSLWRGESSMAVVSGVNFICAPSTYVGFTAMGMLSPDGHCKAFDASANGFVRAEGGCSVILKPLSKALADGDSIYALVAGSACNQDGHTPGLTMPSRDSQEALVREACRVAEISPRQVRYVEAHGTGTPVGDPIETNALGAVLGQDRSHDNPCLIGSVKANIGHLEAGSGIAGLIKATLVLKNRLIPPNIHFNTPNPDIDFDSLRLKVPTEQTILPEGDGPAYAGINSFGFGGTNVHVILQEYHPQSNPVASVDLNHRHHESENTSGGSNRNGNGNGNAERPRIIPISARTPESVRAMAQSYMAALSDNGIWSDASFDDIAFTIACKRSHHDLRTTVIAKNKAELLQQLQQWYEDDSDAWIVTDRATPGRGRPLAFVFSGQGPQWWAMGRELLKHEPIFRHTLERCDEIVRQLGAWSLLEELSRSEETSRINETTYAQPAIFAIQAGLFELMKSWGVKPDVVVGHSVGEVAAAYAAGVLSFEDSVKVIYHRGRTMGVVQEKGAMLAVAMTPAQATSYIEPWREIVCIAAVNGPSTVTLSGAADVIEELEIDLKSRNVFARRLQVNYAFHSYQMDPVRSDLIDSLSDIRPQAAVLPMFSTVTGQLIEGPELGAEYWWQNVRQPVQFVSAMNQLVDRDYSLLLEISPHPVLAGAIGECFTARNKSNQVVTTLRRGEPERVQLLKSLSTLYCLHNSIDWSAIAPVGQFVKLPAYPWHRQSYWSESEDSRVSRLPCVGHPILGARLPGSRLVYQGFIDTHAQPFAMDHKIQGHVLLPGTGFLEIGMALGKEIYGEGNFVVTDVELLKAAFMPEKETLMTHTILDTRTGRYSIETQPLGQPHRPWTVHCVGYLRERTPVAPSVRPNLSDVRKRCTNALPANVFYDFFRRCGFPFGPSFRGLTQIRLGIGEMLGFVEVPTECEADFEKYLFHPAVLDACLQGNFGCFMTHNRTGSNLGDLEERIRKAEIFMPSGYDEVRLYKQPTKRMWSYVRMHERFKDQSSSDIFIFDEDGELIAEVRGFKETLVGTVEGNAETASGLLYQYEWKLQSLPGAAENRLTLPQLDKLVERVLSLPKPSESKLAELRRESGFREALSSLVSPLIANALCSLELPSQAGSTIEIESWLAAAGIQSDQQPLAKHLLALLAQANWISGSEDIICGERDLTVPLAMTELRQLFHRYPEYYAQIALVARCCQRLPQLLRGEVELESVLPTDNLNELRDQLWASSPACQVEFNVAAQFLQTLLSDLRPGQTAKVLELRGSSGRLAAEVLKAMPGDLVEYIFGDQSDKEFARVAEALGSPSNLKFQVVDLDCSTNTFQLPSGNEVNDDTQVSESQSEVQCELPLCEAIIAHEAFDGVTDLAATLIRIRQQLVPGGVLLVIPSASDNAQQITLGLRSLMADVPHDNSTACEVGIAVKDWHALLSNADFTSIHSLAFDSRLAGKTRPIIVAQRPHREPDDVNASVDSKTLLTEAIDDDNSDKNHSKPAEATWLIFADDSGVAEKLAALAVGQGVNIVLVEAGDAFNAVGPNRFTVNPESLADYKEVLSSLRSAQIQKILYLWSLDIPELGTSESALQLSQNFGILAPVLICQAWTQLREATPANLWLVSLSSQEIGAAAQSRTCGSISIGQTTLWGTGRVVMNEFPHLACRLVDLGEACESELNALFGELNAGIAEDEIALRGNARYVHRLVGSSLSKFADRGEDSGQPYRLHLSDYGTLDGMRLRPAQLRETLDLPTLVEIEVHAAALNFSDVMKALALYPGLQEGFVPVGIECAGVITKVGADVVDFKVGDEVVCITPMAISSHTYTDQRLVAHKPKHLSMSAAATLPIAFLTAHYALNYIGRMEEKEKVLINAATGGVGLAAIQLAQATGAELYATAGTSEKRELLEFLGLEHVMNSRTLAFADEIMEQTSNRGVDLILNSLSGEAIAKGMSILADYGRFLEIGKRDIYANTSLGLRAFRKNVSFAAIDLDRGLREKPDLCSKMFRQIIADADQGKIVALPHRVFPVTQLVDAFRYMAKAKHIGKVIVEMNGHEVRPTRDPNQSTIKFDADASYLLTGGLGGLGAHLAQWMVDQGARCLVLASRRGVATEEGLQLVRALEDRGVRIVIEKVDISQADQVRELIQRIDSHLPSLRGIMHAAVVLDDGLIIHLNQERIERVCAPKSSGAWHLHQATLGKDLDFFVCHSSTSSTMGNAGQANYSAANAFLDGLAEYRRSIGLPALTINWGYLGDLGVAAGNQKLAERFEQQGVKPVPPSEGLPILGKLMAFDVNQMAVMRVDWNRLRQLAATMAQSPRFGQMMLSSKSSDDGAVKSGSDIRNLVLATDPEKRAELMLGIIQEKVARVLGTRPDKVEVDRSLMDLGLDSLMGFELRNWIEGELRINVPVVELMQGPTVQKLTNLILAQLEKGENPDNTDATEDNSANLADRIAKLNTDPQQSAVVSGLIAMADEFKEELQGAEEAVDLPGEVRLPEDLFGDNFANRLLTNASLSESIQRILLTGSTGFLGAYVLHHLLQESGDVEVYCLVRAQSQDAGLNRVKQNLLKYDLWNDSYEERLQIVLGDATQPQLGLDRNTYDQLAQEVDLVLHNAAGVNFLQGYSQLKPINVAGTLAALRFAAHGRIKPYHHVSTLFVFSILDHLELGTVRETDKPARHEFLYGGYLQSKWVADGIVQLARSRGMPVTIYRPGIITGDSRSGASSDDVISRTLASAIQLGCCPSDDMRFTFTPVDYVGQAIAKLTLSPETANQSYHLVNQDLIDWATVIGWLREQGYPVEIVPYAQWLELLRNSSKDNGSTMLSSLLPLIPEVQLSGPAAELKPLSFDCSQTDKLLSPSGIQCPKVTPKLIAAYVDYFVRSGLVASAEIESRSV